MKADAKNEVQEPFYPRVGSPHFGNIDPCPQKREEDKLVERGFSAKNGIFWWEGGD